MEGYTEEGHARDRREEASEMDELDMSEDELDAIALLIGGGAIILAVFLVMLLTGQLSRKPATSPSPSGSPSESEAKETGEENRAMQFK